MAYASCHEAWHAAFPSRQATFYTAALQGGSSPPVSNLGRLLPLLCRPPAEVVNHPPLPGVSILRGGASVAGMEISGSPPPVQGTRQSSARLAIRHPRLLTSIVCLLFS